MLNVDIMTCLQILIRYKPIALNKHKEFLYLIRRNWKNISAAHRNCGTVNSEYIGFKKVIEKFSKVKSEKGTQEQTFASLLRNSKFIALGDPRGKVVEGTIFHIVDNDLYIDFGWKFHCVCTKPSKNEHLYKRGVKVKVKIKELELSTRFLGASKDITLLEADCVLLGLL